MADRFEDRRYVSRDEVAEPPRPVDAAAPKDGDPLAELAKLIGQTDPFANFGRANPTHPLRRDAAARGSDPNQPGEDTDEYFDREIFDEAPPPPAWVQHRTETLAGTNPAEQDDLSNRPHPLRRFNSAADAATGEPDAQYADGQYQDAHYGAEAPFQHPGYQNTPYDYPEDYADNPVVAREKSRRGLMTVAAVLGLAIVGTGGAFAYRTFVSGPRSSSEVPVIRADPNPIKVVPPTTAEAANKAIQDRIGGATGETVIPREEQPVDVRDPTKAAARPSGNFTAKAPSSGTVPVPNNALPVPGEEPRRVRTFTVKGDQNDPSGNAAAKQVARAPVPVPAPARPAPPPPGPVANLAPPSSAPLSLNPRANLQAPATSGGYVVQVSSQRSESDAQASYRSLQAKFPSVLGSRSASIKRAELGEKGTYYRAVLGPFGSPEDAAALCSNLKSAGGQCVVQRN